MDIIEQFINANVTSWTIPPNTTKLAGDFEKMLKLKNDKEIGNMINVADIYLSIMIMIRVKKHFTQNYLKC